MERHGVPGEGAEDQRSAAVGVGERRARSGAQAGGEGRDGAPRRRARVEPVVGAVDVDAEPAPAEVPRVRRGFRRQERRSRLHGGPTLQALVAAAATGDPGEVTPCVQVHLEHL